MKNLIKWIASTLSDDNGRPSTMRHIVALGALSGMVVLGFGVAAVFLELTNAVVLVTTGAGLETTAMGAKWLQKMQEVRRSSV